MNKKFGDLTLREIASWSSLDCEHCPLNMNKSYGLDLCGSLRACLTNICDYAEDDFDKLVEMPDTDKEE